MAITRLGSVSSATRTTSGTSANVSHTVTAGTTLLVVTTMYEAGETVSGTPQWSLGGGENLTLVDETTRSGSNNDMCISTYALVNPTSGAGTVTVTHSTNDNAITVAVNYSGTIVSSVADAIEFLAEDVNDAATNSISFSSAGRYGTTLYAAGSFKGGDGDGVTVPTNFAELYDGASGTNPNSDISGYVCDYLNGGASACSWTWAATDENAGHYLQINPAIVFEERWEGTGTEETWGTDTTSGSGSIDDDYAVSNVGSPPWFESQCFQASCTGGTSNAFKQMDLLVENPINYVSFDVVIESHSLASDGQLLTLFAAYDTSSPTAADQLFQFLLQRVNSTTYRFLMLDWRDDTQNASLTTPNFYVEGKPFRFQMLWDDTNNEIIAAIDGHEFLRVSITSTTRTGIEYFRIGLIGSPVAASVVFDNLVIRADRWDYFDNYAKDGTTTDAIWMEQCEATGASGGDQYDMPWSEPNANLGSGNTITGNGTTSDISAPANWDDDACKIVIGTVESGGLNRHNYAGPDITTEFYQSVEFYVEAENTGGVANFNTMVAKSNHLLNENIWSVDLIRSTTADKFRVQASIFNDNDKSVRLTTVEEVSTGEFHKIEGKIDFTNSWYELFFDGVRRQAGWWPSSANQEVGWWMMGQSGSASATDITVWLDNFYIADNGWPTDAALARSNVIVDQDESGDTQSASITVGTAAANITASQTESGDTTAATLDVIIAVTSSQTESGDTAAATLQVINEITASQTEAGDSTAADLDVLAQISSSQTEEGDTQTATIQTPASITANQTEAGDATVADTDVIVNITANQTEAGDTNTALIQVFRDITANQSEAGDSNTVNLEVLLQLSASQAENGDATTANIQTLVTITANQVEDGDVVVADIDVIRALTASQSEQGDANTATLQVLNDIVANQTETGDTNSATLDVLVQLTASQSEVGDTQAATILASQDSTITASQNEAGDTTSATLDVLVEITASVAESGDTQVATLQVFRDITANQTEVGDSNTAALDVIVELTANQTEAGDIAAADVDAVASITASQIEQGDTATASITSPRNITASTTEVGDTNTATIQVLRDVTANQTETGDSTTANLEVLVELTASTAETGDTQAATIIASEDSTITASQSEAGDSQTATLQVINELTVNQTETGDSQVANLNVLVELTASQTEAGDVTVADVDAVSSITASQTEIGDTTAASITSPRNVTANVAEAGDTTTASITSPRNITASLAESGDTNAATLDVIVELTASTTEAGDTQSASILASQDSTITANQSETGDATTAALEVIVELSANQTETGDAATADIDVFRAVSASQTEEGDSQTADFQVAVALVASQAETGDATAASLTALLQVAANQSEFGDSTAASLEVINEISANQFEDGDTNAASLLNVVQLLVNQPEQGDTTAALILGAGSSITANQQEVGDTTVALINSNITGLIDGDTSVVVTSSIQLYCHNENYYSF